MKHLSLLLVLLFACSTLAVAAEEKDMPVPWTVDITHVPAKRVVVDDPVKGRLAYWYIEYELHNPYDDPKEIYPEFEIVNSHGKHFAENLFPKAKERAELIENEHYLDAVEVRGIIEPGETKRGIAIFKQIQRDTNAFSLFVRGLSAVEVQQADGKKARATVKVFKADYYWAGDRYHFDPEMFEQEKIGWIVEDLDIDLNIAIPDVSE